jgi:hypothetical protein
MTDKESSDFPRFELLIIHRLSALEELTKEQHKAFEDLRVELATLKSVVQTRTTLISGGISLLVAVLALALPLLF